MTLVRRFIINLSILWEYEKDQVLVAVLNGKITSQMNNHFLDELINVWKEERNLNNYYKQKIPLIFPHIIISSWTPYFLILWEKYNWKGQKYNHAPNFSLKPTEIKAELDFILKINNPAKNSGMIQFQIESDEIIKDSGTLLPWTEEKDLKISEILFQAGFHIYGLNID